MVSTKVVSRLLKALRLCTNNHVQDVDFSKK